MTIMAGTKAGIRLQIETKYESHEEFRDHMRKLGSLGGRKSRTGGFYARRDLASAAGRIGGMSSRRYPVNATWRKQHAKRLAVAYAHLQAVQDAAAKQVVKR